MGSGKSTWAINYINQNPDKKFLCVVPLLDECERYKEATDIEVSDPDNFGSKWDNFQELIEHDKNVVTTHSMIKNVDQDMMELLHAKDYIVIIDECLETIAKHKLTKHDNDILFHQHLISMDEDGYIVWDDNSEDYKGKYNVTKKRCLAKTLMGFKTESGEMAKIVMWNFPVNFFECFDESYVLTYMWDGSIQKAYFDIHGIEYVKKMIGDDHNLVPYDRELELSKRKEVAKLITIYEGKLNSVGDKIGRSNPLSKSWYRDKIRNNPAMINLVCKNTENFFRSYAKTKSKDNVYTVFRSCRKQVRGDGFTKGYLPCNASSINSFENKKSLAYLINYFVPPEIKIFVTYYGFKFDEDVYALTALLQWIGRSQIRNRKPVCIYIPSERMRNLLKNWIEECNE